jgi:hypothetical protein
VLQLLDGKSKHSFDPKEHGQSHGQLKKGRMITQTDTAALSNTRFHSEFAVSIVAGSPVINAVF